MSTTDPLEARRRHDAARIGSPAALTGVAIGLLMIAIGAALASRALFGFAEFDASSDTDPPPLAIAGMIAGLPLLIIGFFVHVTASRRFTGRLLSAPIVGPLPILFAGIAAGSWWGVLSLPSPGGLRLLPIGLTVLAAAFLLLSVLVRVRRRARRDLLADVLAHGRITDGVVVEIAEIDPTSGGLIGPITVRFADAGTDRWVQKTGQWPRHELPATGDDVSVLYDPARPSDTSRIWLAPHGSTTAADFTRWHA